MKKILILGKQYKYWSKKLTHIKNLLITDDIYDLKVDILMGHQSDIMAHSYTSFTRLKWIQLLSAGTSVKFRKRFSQKYIITTSKGIHGQSMFEYILHGLLTLDNKDLFKKKKFEKWQRTRRNLVLNDNQNILLLGAGNIGFFLAKQFSKIGMKVDVLVTSLRKIKHVDNVYTSIKKINLKKYSIIISTLPHTDKTKDFVDKNFLCSMSKNSKLISLGEGGVVNELALFNVLKKKKIRGAILDTYKKEPIEKNFFLLNKLDNCLCSPHISGYFDGSHDLFINKFNELYKKYLSGNLKSEIYKGY